MLLQSPPDLVDVFRLVSPVFAPFPSSRHLPELEIILDSLEEYLPPVQGLPGGPTQIDSVVPDLPDPNRLLKRHFPGLYAKEPGLLLAGPISLCGLVAIYLVVVYLACQRVSLGGLSLDLGAMAEILSSG